MKRFNRILLTAILGATTATAFAAESDVKDGPRRNYAPGSFLSSFEYEIEAGLNIGGASPLPLPAEIRKIDGFNPGLNLMLGVKAVKWITPDSRWGVGVGLRFETKGMTTNATVKNYGMEIIDDGARVSGRWTGKVHTHYKTSQFTLPITAEYRITPRWTVNAGPYIALAMENNFDGYVHDGYLREGDPTGEKAVFEGDSRAVYDFDDNLRNFQWGMMAGASWVAYKHLSVNANLAWGCQGIFKSSFKTITFSMYPIFLNIGFGYKF